MLDNTSTRVTNEHFVCVDIPLQMSALSVSEETPQCTPRWYTCRDF